MTFKDVFLTTLKVVLALALSGAAHAQQPYSVKEDVLGETLAQWQANHPTIHCSTPEERRASIEKAYQKLQEAYKAFPGIHVSPRPEMTQQPETWCSYPDDFTYADTKVKWARASFYHDRLYKVNIGLPNGRLEEIKAALRAKYGVPVHETTTLQNGYGALFTQDSFRWENGVSSLTLEYCTACNDEEHGHPSITFYYGPALKELLHDRVQPPSKDL